MSKLTPTRIDIISDKFMALEGWIVRGKSVMDDQKKLEVVASNLLKCADDLLMCVRTPDVKGQEWGWWQ